jgi:hypothetical protein
MEDSEVKTQIADIQEQSVAPITTTVTKPEESVAAPTAENAPAEQPETKGETEKGVSSGVQKRIDQVTAKFYAALDEKKQLEKRVKELEESARPQTAPKEVSMFEESEDNAELVNLQKTVAQVRQELDTAKQAKRFSEFSEFVSEMREKYDSVTDEEAIKIVEELNNDDVPPEAHGAIEKYFAARERNVLATKLQEKETKQERKQAVTEGKTVVSSDHLPDDDVERLHLLTTDPAKYEELAKKSGLRG